MKALSVLIALVIWGAAAQAGELRRGSDGPQTRGAALCDYRFQGAITRGDAAKLDAIPRGVSGKTLCLDSSGGDFNEALKIFDILWTKGLRAAILPGDQCTGACALAFLGGSQSGVAKTSVPARELHIGGALGFYSPGIPLEASQSYSAGAVESGAKAAMRAAQAVHDVRQTSRGGRRGMTELLYDRVLRASEASAYSIDRVGRAVLAEVQVFGAAYPEAFSKRHALAVCDLAYLRHQPAGRDGKPVDRMVRQLQRDISRNLNGAPHLDRVRKARRGSDTVTLVRGYPTPGPRSELVCQIDQPLDRALPAYDDIQAYRGSAEARTFDVTFFARAGLSRDAFAALAPTSLQTIAHHTSVPYFAIYGADTRLEDLPRQIEVATTRKVALPQLNFAEPQDLPRARFTRLDSIDLVGADLTQRGHRPVSLSACERICRETQNCRAYTWVREKEWCFPKAGDNGRRINNGMVSGVRR